MKRILTVSGTSTALQDLMPIMRAQTTLALKDDTYYPFRPTISYFESDALTSLDFNGEGDTILKDDGTGVFLITLEQGMVTTKTLVIKDAVNWTATILF